MSLCANGHDSSTEDYCDTCGIRMGGPAATPAASGAAGGAVAPATTPSGTVTPDVEAGDCANCGAARVGGERFCEICGMDFDTGKLPEAPTPTPAPVVADPASGAVVNTPAPNLTGIGWAAVLTCDQGWWNDNTGAGGVADGVPFPDPVPAPRRVVLLQRANLIGRTSGSSVADVDCGGSDTGVSRRHAQLSLADDGSWTVTDLGSTNGTFIGDANTKLAPNAETALDPTTAIKIGAFTVIRLEPTDDPAA